jgi:hypothetical protein
MKDINLSTNLTEFNPTHGVAIGSNPNQPETDKELEIVIKALRLINVGDINAAQTVISNAKFNDKQREFLIIELNTVLAYVRTN